MKRLGMKWNKKMVIRMRGETRHGGTRHTVTTVTVRSCKVCPEPWHAPESQHGAKRNLNV